MCHPMIHRLVNHTILIVGLEWELPREEDHKEENTPLGDIDYKEGRFSPLGSFTKWSEDGNIKAPAKFRMVSKKEDEFDSSLQMQNYENTTLKCLSHNLDDSLEEISTHNGTPKKT